MMTNAELVEVLTVLVESGKLTEDEADAVLLAARIIQRKLSAQQRIRLQLSELKRAADQLVTAAQEVVG